MGTDKYAAQEAEIMRGLNHPNIIGLDIDFVKNNTSYGGFRLVVNDHEENKATEAENTTDLKYKNGLLDKLGETTGKILEGEEKVAKAYAGTNGSLQYLNLGDRKGYDITEMLALLTGNKKTKGGSSATT